MCRTAVVHVDLVIFSIQFVFFYFFLKRKKREREMLLRLEMILTTPCYYLIVLPHFFAWE